MTRRNPETNKGPAPDGLCAPHARITAEIAALPDEDEALAVEPENEEPSVPVAIESLRDALRGAVQTSEVASLMESMLLDALRASKVIWHSCSYCKRRSTVQLPDLATRVSAITKLLESLEGRLRDSAEEEWNSERRAIEKRQEDLASLHGFDLNEEIEHLSAVVGEDPTGRDENYDRFSTDDVTRFVMRLEDKTK